MRTLIKNGTIVTADSQFVGDILVDGEKIKADTWYKLDGGKVMEVE